MGWRLRLSNKTARNLQRYCRRRKCSQGNVVSGSIRFMQIFAGIPWGGGVKWECGRWKWRFSLLSFTVFRTFYIHGHTTAFTWCDCRWPWRYFKVIGLFHIKFLKNGAWYGKSYYRQLGSHRLDFDWCHFWWLWMTFEGHFTLPSPVSHKLYRISPQKLKLLRHQTSAFRWYECRWPWRYFKVIKLFYIKFLKNGAWYGKSYCRLLIGSHTYTSFRLVPLLMNLNDIWRSFQPSLSFLRPFLQSLTCFRVARSPSNSWASCSVCLALALPRRPSALAWLGLRLSASASALPHDFWLGSARPQNFYICFNWLCLESPDFVWLLCDYEICGMIWLSNPDFFILCQGHKFP